MPELDNEASELHRAIVVLEIVVPDIDFRGPTWRRHLRAYFDAVCQVGARYVAAGLVIHSDAFRGMGLDPGQLSRVKRIVYPGLGEG